MHFRFEGFELNDREIPLDEGLNLQSWHYLVPITREDFNVHPTDFHLGLEQNIIFRKSTSHDTMESHIPARLVTGIITTVDISDQTNLSPQASQNTTSPPGSSRLLDLPLELFELTILFLTSESATGLFSCNKTLYSNEALWKQRMHTPIPLPTNTPKSSILTGNEQYIGLSSPNTGLHNLLTFCNLHPQKAAFVHTLHIDFDRIAPGPDRTTFFNLFPNLKTIIGALCIVSCCGSVIVVDVLYRGTLTTLMICWFEVRGREVAKRGSVEGTRVAVKKFDKDACRWS